MEHLKQETVSGAQLNLGALYQICPQCFTESKDPKTGEVKHTVDFDKLRLLLGDNVAEGDERYEFTWVGKRAALQETAKPIRKTLRPCPEESVDWDNTKNLYIEGDNLEVLKLLQNSYMGKVKMIYIDPPYNTGNDFVYHDDFHQTKKDFDLFSGDVTEEGERLVKNTESNGRFHSDWCSMIYSRLLITRTLLADDGVIFISIDDNEQSNLIKICNEIFGSENFQGMFIINASPSAIDYGHIAKMHEYAVMYSKNALEVSTNQIQEKDKSFKYTDDKGGFILYPLYNGNVAFNPDTRPNLYYPFYLNQEKKLDNGFFEIGLEKKEGWKEVWPVVSRKEGIPRVWRWGKEKAKENLNIDIVGYLNEDGEFRIVQKYRGDKKTIRSLLLDNSFSSRRGTAEVQELFSKKVFSFPKPINLVKLFSSVGANEDSIVLDFFSGSATTAHAVMQLNAEDGGNRKFIMIQLPEVVEEKSEAYKSGYKDLCEIGKERIRRAGKKILEEQKAKQGDLFSGDKKPLDVGFRVFKCADSNMKDVYYTPADYSQQLLLELEDNIKDDRNDLDLLFGCMLDWGVTLDLPMRTEKVDGVTIHIVNDGDLVACFDHSIPETAIDYIASLLPMRVVLRDSCFSEAKEKMNFFEIFKQRTGWSEEEVRKNVKVI